MTTPIPQPPTSMFSGSVFSDCSTDCTSRGMQYPFSEMLVQLRPKCPYVHSTCSRNNMARSIVFHSSVSPRDLLRSQTCCRSCGYDIADREVVVISSHRLVNEVCDERRFKKSISASLGQVRNLVGDGLFTVSH